MEKYRIDTSKGMQFGIYTLGDHMPDPHTGERIPAHKRVQEIIVLAQLAGQSGIDWFCVGESHHVLYTAHCSGRFDKRCTKYLG